MLVAGCSPLVRQSASAALIANIGANGCQRFICMSRGVVAAFSLPLS